MEFLLSANPTNSSVNVTFNNECIYCFDLQNQLKWQLKICDTLSIKVLYKDYYTLKSYLEVVSKRKRYIISENGEILNVMSNDFGDRCVYTKYSTLPRCFVKSIENGTYDLKIVVSINDSKICQIFNQFNNCVYNGGSNVFNIKYRVDNGEILLFSRHNINLSVTAKKTLCKTVHLLGDSTVSNYDILPNFGWGQLLNNYIGKDYLINNLACPGRSLKSCMYEGFDLKVINEAKKGDICLIQFGHNDQKLDNFSANIDEFEILLLKLVKKLVEKKIQVILVTPIERRNIIDKKFIPTLSKYVNVYENVGLLLNLKIIDLSKYTLNLYKKLGIEQSKKLFVRFEEVEIYDNTHLNLIGANIIAKYVSENLK